MNAKKFDLLPIADKIAIKKQYPQMRCGEYVWYKRGTVWSFSNPPTASELLGQQFLNTLKDTEL